MTWRTLYYSPRYVMLVGNGSIIVASPTIELGRVNITIARVKTHLHQTISVSAIFRPDGPWLWSRSVPDDLWGVVHKAAWLVWNLNHIFS